MTFLRLPEGKGTTRAGGQSLFTTAEVGPPIVPKAGPVKTFNDYSGTTVLNRLDSSVVRFSPLLRYPLVIPQGLNTWVVIGYTIPSYPPFSNPTSLPFSWQLVTADPTTKAVTVGPAQHQSISSSAPSTLGAIGNDGSFLVMDATDHTITAVWFGLGYTSLSTATMSPTLAPTSLAFCGFFTGYNVNQQYNIAYVNKSLAICLVRPCPSYPSGALVSVSPLGGGTLSTLQLSTLGDHSSGAFISIALYDATHVLLVYGSPSVINFYTVPFDPSSGSLGTPVLHPAAVDAVATTGGYTPYRSHSPASQDWNLGQPRAYQPGGFIDDNYEGYTSTNRDFYTDNTEVTGFGGGGVGYLDPTLSQTLSSWPSTVGGYADRGTAFTFVAPGWNSSSTDSACEYVGAPFPQAIQPFYSATDTDFKSRSDGWVFAGAQGQDQVTTVLNVRYEAPGDANMFADPHTDNLIFWATTSDPAGVPISDGRYGSDGFWGGRGAVDSAGTPLWVVPSQTSGYYVTAGQQRTVVNGSYTGAVFSSYQFEYCNLDYGSYPGCTWDYSLPNASIHNADLSHGSFEQDCFYYTEASYCNFTNSLMGNDGNFEAYASDFTASDFTNARFSVPGNSRTTVARCDFTGAILRGCDMRHVAFNQCSFIGADMTGAVFDGSTSFTGCLLDATTTWPLGFNPVTMTTGSVGAFADYSNQTLTGTDLSGVFLAHANFENAVLTDVNLGSDYVGWANFRGARLFGTTFTRRNGVAAPWADFTNATIDFGTTKLSSYNLPYGIDIANWAHANFQNVQFTFGGVAGGVSIPIGTPITIDASFGCAAYCNFNGVKNPPGYPLFFEFGNFSYSTFVGARLYDSTTLPQCAVSGADVGSLMAYCDFTGLQGGWFVGCNLTGSTFKNANLPVTCFTNCNLCDVNFTGATGITPAAFDVTVTGNLYVSEIGRSLHPTPWSPTEYDMRATHNANTILPAGITTAMLIPAVTDVSQGNSWYSSLTSAYSYFKDETITYLDGRWGGNADGRNKWQMMVYYGSCPGMVFTPSIYGYHNFEEAFGTDFRGADLMGSVWDDWTSSSFTMCNFGQPSKAGVARPRGKSPAVPQPPKVRIPTVRVAALSTSKATASPIQNQ